MIEIQKDDNKTYLVTFRHIMKERWKGTACEIEEVTTWNPSYSREVTFRSCRRFTGHTILHPDDTYDRKLGRKLAFSRAVAQLPRQDRPLLWLRVASQTRLKGLERIFEMNQRLRLVEEARKKLREREALRLGPSLPSFPFPKGSTYDT